MSCSTSQPIQRPPDEHRGRVGGLADAQARLLNLPATATLHEAQQAVRGLFQEAETAKVVQTSHRPAPTRWQRLVRFFRRR